jgi:hypothetical protein
MEEELEFFTVSLQRGVGHSVVRIRILARNVSEAIVKGLDEVSSIKRYEWESIWADPEGDESSTVKE